MEETYDVKRSAVFVRFEIGAGRAASVLIVRHKARTVGEPSTGSRSGEVAA